MIGEGLLALLERCKGLRSLLKDLGLGVDIRAYPELISPMPYCPHHHSQEVHVLPFLMNQVDPVLEV